MKAHRKQTTDIAAAIAVEMAAGKEAHSRCFCCGGEEGSRQRNFLCNGSCSYERRCRETIRANAKKDDAAAAIAAKVAVDKAAEIRAIMAVARAVGEATAVETERQIELRRRRIDAEVFNEETRRVAAAGAEKSAAGVAARKESERRPKGRGRMAKRPPTVGSQQFRTAKRMPAQPKPSMLPS